ncbi:MAG: SurA N-terminal domain-containing protein [Nitrospirae bacterium]|nr:SurA N-terminal domain-containing protein [Nitrospirota bacterium]
MLTLIRRKRFRRYVKIVFGVVAFVFIIGFALDVSNVGQQQDALVAAKVNGEVISTLEISRIYRDQVRDRYSELTPEQRKQLNLPKQVLDDVIESRLILAEVPELGFKVGGEQLRENIQGRPYFQEKGQFSMERYRRILQQAGTNPAQFEASERDSISLEAVQNLLSALTYVPAAAVDRASLMKNIQANVEVLEIDPDEVAKTLKPGAADLQAHFESHKDSYKTDEKRKVEFVEFPDQSAVQKAAEALGESKDLAKRAGEMKWELKRTSWLTRHGTVDGISDAENFLAQAFLLGAGEIGPPLNTGGKYFLIRVAEIEAPRPAAFEEVKERVRADWLKDKSGEAARLKAETLLAKARGAKNLKSLKIAGAPVSFETGLFSAETPSISRIGDSKDFKVAVFGLSPEKRWPDKPVQVGRKWYVLRLVELKLPTKDDWVKDRTEAQDDLSRLKRFELLRHWRQTLKDKSKIKINEDALKTLS